jgi:hypothetical protein
VQDSYEFPTPFEIAIALVSIVVVALGTVYAADAFSLFSKHFWNDEWVTHLIASDPSPSRAARALWNAIDNNPPTLVVLLRAAQSISFAGAETTYRSVMLMATVAGLLGVYVTLRQQFSIGAAGLAVLALWAHPVLLWHTFDARFYAPLFCAAVWYAYTLGRAVDAGSWRYSAMAGLAGVVLCTLHYFGILCLSIILTGELFRKRERHSILLGAVSAIPGVCALAIFLPLLLAQRQANGMTSYLPTPSPGLLWSYLTELLLPEHLVAIVVVAALTLLLGLRESGSEPEATGSAAPRTATGVVGLASLLLVPAVLALFSVIVQGALLVRYAVPSLAGLSPGVGALVRRFGRVSLVAAATIFLLSSTRTLKHMAENQRQSEARDAALIDAIRRHTDDAPVTFESHLPYDLSYYAPDIIDRVYILGDDAPSYDVPEVHTPYSSEGAAPLAWARGWAVRYEQLYGSPRVMSWARLQTLPRKFIVVGNAPSDLFAPSGQPYPGFHLQQVELSIYELIANSR